MRGSAPQTEGAVRPRRPKVVFALLCLLVAGLATGVWKGIGASENPGAPSHEGADHQARQAKQDAEAAAELASMAYGDAHPAWSPDGQLLVFDSAPAGGKSQLYLVRADGRGLRRLRSTTNDFDPSWSPDGREIVFVSNPRSDEGRRSSERDGALDELFVVSVKGGWRRRLTRNRFDESSPVWSPDGRTIAFGQTRSLQDFHPKDGIFVLPAAGGLPKVVATGFNIDPYAGRAGLTWSPDGRRLAAPAPPGDAGIVLVTVAKGTVGRSLTSAAEEPSWSPDGRWIVYSTVNDSECGSLGDCYELASSLSLVSADGRKVRGLTRGKHFDEAPAWSPTGERIAFVRDGSLVVVDVRGGDVHEVYSR